MSPGWKRTEAEGLGDLEEPGCEEDLDAEDGALLAAKAMNEESGTSAVVTSFEGGKVSASKKTSPAESGGSGGS